MTFAGGAEAASQRMRGFEALAAQGERVDVTGIGWGDRGRFKLGVDGAAGRYAYGAAAAEWIDHVERWGGSFFELSGSDLAGAMAGQCRFDQGEDRERGDRLTVDTVVRPLTYDCEFIRDGQRVGELMLDAVFADGLTIKVERRGELRFNGLTLTLRSVHDFEAGPWPTATPLGYLIEADGRTVGAVDLNGGTKRLVLPKDPALREAVIAASLALAFFRDPGNDD